MSDCNIDTTIPLSLYVHIPWCVHKCPYCDFNSHVLKGDIPEHNYINALLDDLHVDLAYFNGASERELHSIFIGGGTPSLMSPEEISRLLIGINAQVSLKDDIEITMEANPGTIEADKFIAYRSIGINQISIGIQSFDDQQLKLLARIHDSEEAKRAVKLAHEAGLNSFNLDLMHGLPAQSIDSALDDLKQAIALDPPHLSWYQLTIEPNTLYYSKRPTLPNDDDLWNIFEQGYALLTDAGYVQYETSGYSKPGYQCQHNLNYWRFGDYIGIGCGAHGKITDSSGTVHRTVKVKYPRGYLNHEKEYRSELHIVETNELPLEFFMNRFRLVEACPKKDFNARTGLALNVIQTAVDNALKQDLLSETETHWQVTQKGRLFLNDLLIVFINE
ncbi:radical SAM family heme chaperone HemW [Candidatus Enterovibrio altilux]|uniref:Heme chaperone HemW n=1 Tax=Candidatus Enterovibrio altilux TaxID=1927128 RepID=A0A291B9B3_9GAMM|nr:radical SAM family heme chaperone HemW [Candidatus Enterovibrio luxaltus]ATF09600.1 Radical SAM family enzyme [Candidatus Enterovibrio luxaltus]